MKNLFEQTTYTEIVNRVNQLSVNSERKWGKMNVAQMLTHAAIPLEYAIGDRHGKQSFIGKIFRPFVKKAFFDERPYTRDLPTAPEFKINPTDEKEFNSEKSKLVTALNRFHKDGKNIAGNQQHLFLGKITADEWARTMYKHLDHHLSQFGV